MYTGVPVLENLPFFLTRSEYWDRFMQPSFLSVMLDLMMAGLLVATLVYCLKLNRRIRLLQDSKSELARIIREFDDSTKRATQNINEIHAATSRLSENIQHKIDKASYLADDLEIMIERVNKITAKPELAAARVDRTPAPAPSAPPRKLSDIMPARMPEPAPAAPPADSAARPVRGRSRAEQDLMNVMQKNQNDSGR
jgi:hypothetical protein